MLESIKKNWVIITILGFSITFSSRLYAMWQTPQKVEELADSLIAYTAGEKEANKQRDKLIELLAKKAMER